MLSDRTIRRLLRTGELEIRYIDFDQIQSVSVDLRLESIADYQGNLLGFDGDYLGRTGYWMVPQQFVLGCTIEYLKIPNNLVGQVHGKSTRARQGLIVESAGLVDPGFQGQLTLEIFNMSHMPVFLEFGSLMAQISFDWVDTTPEHSYGHPALNSHYQGQTGPTPARF